MSTARHLHHTYGDYLSAQEASDVRLEYWAGEICAMAGGTPEYAALSAQVIALLATKLPSGCRPFSSDMKVRIPSVDVTVYPDASVVCGRVERARDDKHATLNPGLIIEVTSPSTEDYDRGAKLKHYKLIKSVQAIWIVSHAVGRVTVVERHKKGWKVSDRGASDTLTLASPPLTIDVAAIYRALDGL